MLVETLDTVETMANPLDTIKKMKGRSFKEIRTRSEQAISARAEQIGLSGQLPSDAELFGLIFRERTVVNSRNRNPFDAPRPVEN
jgi:hypothetical protein